MALTTTSKLKLLLGVRGTANDARYDALRVAAEQVVKDWCNSPIEAADYTEYLDGGGSRFLVLKRCPVNSVATVEMAVRGTYGQGPSQNPYDYLTVGTDYAVALADSPLGKSGILVRLGGVWPEHPGYAKTGVLTWEREPGLGNVRVTYNAGLTVIPESLQLAVCEVAAFVFRTSARGGADYSERLGDHSYMIPMARIRTAPELGTVRSILSKYRDCPW